MHVNQQIDDEIVEYLMMKNSVDVNNEDSVQSYDQGSKYEQSGNIGDQQQISFTTEGAHSKLNYNQSPTTSLRDKNEETLYIQCKMFDIQYHPQTNIDNRRGMINSLKLKIEATLRQCREYGIEYPDIENVEDGNKFLKCLKEEYRAKDLCNELSIKYIKTNNDPNLRMQMKENIRRKILSHEKAINVSSKKFFILFKHI